MAPVIQFTPVPVVPVPVVPVPVVPVPVVPVLVTPVEVVPVDVVVPVPVVSANSAGTSSIEAIVMMMNDDFIIEKIRIKMREI
jgi:hypothetical protein